MNLLLQSETVPVGNGAVLHYRQTDRFKSASFSVNFLFPQAEGCSAADSLVPSMLRHGCDTYPTEQALLTRLEELYNTDFSHECDRMGDLRFCGFTADYLENAYVPDATDLEKEVLSLLFRTVFNPAPFRPEDLRREKDAHTERLRAIRNHKSAYAVSVCRRMMADPHRYDVPVGGTEQETEAVTPTLLAEQYRYMIDNSELHLTYVGPTPLEVILKRVSDELAGMCFPVRTKGSLSFGKRRAGKLRRAEEKTDGTQSILAIGFRTGVFAGEPGTALYPLLTGILSDSPMAKLFITVREKRKLCYSIGATADLNAGTLIIYAGIDRENREVTARAIKAELRKCRNGQITEAELSCAKLSYVNAVLALTDSADDLESMITRRAVNRSQRTVEEQIALISEATVEDIAKLASAVTVDAEFFLSAGEDGTCE